MSDLVSSGQLQTVVALFNIFVSTNELPAVEEDVIGIGTQKPNHLALGQHLCAQVALHIRHWPARLQKSNRDDYQLRNHTKRHTHDHTS